MSSYVDERKRACIEFPKGATVEQGVRVIVRYIEARPQRCTNRLCFLAIEALHDAWPCRK
jgi:hypothetical protein